MPARKNHLKEGTARTPAVVERAQTLISDDPGQSLRVLMDIVWPYVFQQNSSYDSFDSKLALRQRRFVLVQEILTSQQPRFKSLGLLRMEHS